MCCVQSPAIKFRLVFFCFISWPSVDRFGKIFGGLVIQGQVKSGPNFCSFGPQRAEKRTLEGGKCQPKLNSRTLANFGPIKGTFRRLTEIYSEEHVSSIFRQSSNPVCGSWKTQAS